MVELTRRQSEIADCIIGGKTYKEIAHELSISDSTVRTHIHQLYKKFGVNHRNKLLVAIMYSKSYSAADLLHERYPSISVERWEKIVGEVIDALELS